VQQQSKGAAGFGRQLQAAARGEIDRVDFRTNRPDGRCAQGFLHRPQRLRRAIAAVRWRAHDDKG
jgi:hypothetical protein